MKTHRLTITLETGNAAFEGDEEAEIARVLHDLANRIAVNPLDNMDGAKLRDSNGNTVGTLKVEP